MTLISASKLTKYFGADEIFSNISLTIHPGESIALVGVNGCGKSTLLDMIAGHLIPDEGEIHRARDVRLGYLPQSPDFESDATLWEAMDAVFTELHAQQAELRRLEAAMATDDPDLQEDAMARYGRRLDAFERAGGYTYETRIERVLSGLGFTEAQYQQPVRYFSGGEKTRALLARLLLEEPDLLLLDEPTNHLDLEGIEWLESYLQQWSGAMIVVAHDRAFLDAVANRVWDMHHRRMDAYKGNYTAYAQQRAERRERQQARYEAQQQKIAETEDFIQRYMAGQRSSQAKGRLKRLNRMERLEAPQDYQDIHIDLQTQLRSGDLVLRLKELSVGYEPAQPLVAIEKAEVHRGACVALIGPNGSGKTSLLRTLLNDIPPLDGHIRLGAGVHVGYFAQIQAHLDPTKRVIDTLLDAGMSSLQATRSFLARYGFRGETVFKDIGVLSGGEQARVALALLTLQQANFLLLDEPTNHLDIRSQETLQEVIDDFNGTVLMVSHDRYLIREIATHVWAIVDGRLHQFSEGYAQYEAWHQAQNESRAGNGESEAAQAWEARQRAQRERQRALDRQQQRLESLEERIHTLETRLQRLTTDLNLAGRAQDTARVSKLGAEYRKVEAEMDRLLEEWSEVAELSDVPEMSVA
jgi:ATP-binding cassette, subfamily F, member 3